MPGDDKVWKQIRKKLIQLGAENTHVKVGVLSGKGGAAEHDGITMLELAAIHEFGSPAAGIPERSFIRFTMQDRRDDLNKTIESVGKAFATDKMDLDKALGVLGMWTQTAIKRSITDRKIRQELSPVTIAKKGSDTALVDTGRLLNAIQWQISKGDK
jgi:hypothetical protein